MLLEEVAARFFAARAPLEGHRAQRVVREILGGATFTEACRAAMIPRGSQGRYRLLLRKCFWDVLHLDRKPNTSSPTLKSAETALTASNPSGNPTLPGLLGLGTTGIQASIASMWIRALSGEIRRVLARREQQGKN